MAEQLVCRTEELEDGGTRIIAIGELEIGVFRQAGKLYAYRNVCPHQGGPVCEGLKVAKVEDVFGEHQRLVGQKLNQNEIHFVCPWHGYEFRMANGECVGDPKLRVKSYPVSERDGSVFVAL